MKTVKEEELDLMTTEIINALEQMGAINICKTRKDQKPHSLTVDYSIDFTVKVRSFF